MRLTNVVAIAAGGNHGVALVSPDPPLLHPFLLNPSMSTAGFSVSLPTHSANVYGLEFKNSLSDSTWTPLPLLAGNGATVVLRDPTAVTNQARVYRARRW